jgi:RHS repeat-associated protein
MSRRDWSGTQVEVDGAKWAYAWNGHGMLREVTRPDGTRVAFEYDPFARRTTKKLLGAGGDVMRETRFVWDGNDVVHEVDRVTTWHWEPESYAPVMKEHDGRRWSVVSDHLGTPTEMYDEAGALAWKMQLDVFGVAECEAGTKEDCPWRWPGQYEDEETGWVYNRWRYYDSGEYTSIDPLGLEGGLSLYTYVANPTIGCDPQGLRGEFGLAPYASPRHARDGLDAHEFLQNAWLEKHGYITKRGRGISRANPSLAITEDPLHLAINAAQRNAGLYNEATLRGQSAATNIFANEAIFKQEAEAYLRAQGKSAVAAERIAGKAAKRGRNASLRFARKNGCL